VDNNIYMFGGTNDINKLDDFWKFNLDTNIWSEIKLDLSPVVIEFKD